MAVCSWCGTDAEEAKARHEGPHATWCVHYPGKGWQDDFQRAMEWRSARRQFSLADLAELGKKPT